MNSQERIESTAANDSPELLRYEKRLPPLLSVIAGMVDVIGFLSLGVFTAHVTGNLVVIAALLVRGGTPNMAQVLSVPVFVIAVAAGWRIAHALNRGGPSLARPLLMIQFLLLTCVLIFTVVYVPAANPHGGMAVVASMIAVSAIACQFALLHLSMPGSPSTAAMTDAALSFLDTLSRRRPLTENADARLKRTLKVVVGFFAGCIAGAVGVSWLGEWAWSLPVVLAGAAVVLR